MRTLKSKVMGRVYKRLMCTYTSGHTNSVRSSSLSVLKYVPTTRLPLLDFSLYYQVGGGNIRSLHSSGLGPQNVRNNG